MNGAESLVLTLAENAVEVCFTNPGTSEMHFVSALDKVPGVRCVLGLFEGVVTGAADGYYRIADKPASTLLHLGPGLGNGLANLHNAKKANSGVVNIVGEHALHHIECDAPLTSDIEGVARPMSHWVKTTKHSMEVSKDGALAIEQALKAPGQVATLILPADTAWGPGGEVVRAKKAPPRPQVSQACIERIAQVLASPQPKALLLGGLALRAESLFLAGQIAAKTGCVIHSEYNNARIQRGAGRVKAKSIPFSVNAALEMLKDFKHIVLVGAKKPVAFFGYPNKPSYLFSQDCVIDELAALGDDIHLALKMLVDHLGASQLRPILASLDQPTCPEGPFDQTGIAKVLAALIPENAIVVDESITTGRDFDTFTSTAQPHDWLNLMGGSIGFALPAAVGAAIAAPDRTVMALEGDGSAMYTLQALWTMARENLNVKVIIFANQSYEILKGELINVGATGSGEKALSMLNLNSPALDWVGLAKSQGVEAFKVRDLKEFFITLKNILSKQGPQLIEVAMHQQFN